MDAQTEDANSCTPLSANCPVVLRLEGVKEVIAHLLTKRELQKRAQEDTHRRKTKRAQEDTHRRKAK